MVKTRQYNAKQNKSVTERQIPYDLTHMWNLRKTKAAREKKRERETTQETDSTIENKNSNQRGGDWEDEGNM